MKRTLFLIFLSAILFGCQESAYSPGGLLESEEIALKTDESATPTEDEIGNILKSLFPEKAASRSASQYTVTTKYAKDGTPAVYIINYPDDGGFALISATKTYAPILAFSDKGNYDVYSFDKPGGLQMWENATEEALEYSIKHPEEIPDSIKRLWDAYRASTVESLTTSRATSDILERIRKEINDSLSSWRSKSYEVIPIDNYTPANSAEAAFIEQLPENVYWQCMDNWIEYCYVVKSTSMYTKYSGNELKSTWAQSGSYNSTFPYITVDGIQIRPVAGCGPVAVGQIMRFYEYPTSKNWSKMPLTSGSQTTSDFLYEIGVKSNASFGLQTSTELPDLLNTLKSYGYTKSTSGKYNESTVISEISAGRPVILTGSNKAKEDGHAWVADGIKVMTFRYETAIYSVNPVPSFSCGHVTHETASSPNYMHHNWGWGGSSNGYYLVGDFSPSNFNFSYNMFYIKNIAP